MKLEELKKYKKILILGYGKEGSVTEQFLKKYHPDCIIGIADKSDGEEYLEKQYEYDLVIKTPGIQKELVKVTYTTATNIFFANKGPGQVIGVTGSKGKSTTSSLIHHILRHAGRNVRLTGNIGTPALQALLDQPQENTIFVYELSSYQLDDIQYSPHISVIVSLFPEHMNYHGSEEHYYGAKHKIISKSTQDDYYVYNADYPLLKTWAENTTAKTEPFETDYIPAEIPLLGEHNRSNVRGAITVARILGIADSTSEEAIKSFQALPHRLQNVGTFKGITFYDDAISTTPESTIAALEAISDVSTIFLGGEDRGYSYEHLVRMLQEKNVTHIVLFPQTGTKILNAIEEVFTIKPVILQTESMEEAIRFAYAYTEAGKVCLLSTASPSYSLWKNFEEKGDQFQLYVKKLSNE